MAPRSLTSAADLPPGDLALTPVEEPPSEQEIEPISEPGATAALLRVFRHRNYRLYFAGQLVSLMGTWMQNVAQGLARLQA